MFLARRYAIALLLAGFRIWRRLPADEKRRVLDAVSRHGPRLAMRAVRRRRV